VVEDALALDSPRWAELQHAYGAAEDIPALLRQLDSGVGDTAEEEPWFTLWSAALAHQDDVYAASFAAVPHVIEAIATDPTGAGFTFFQFPAWIEICRIRNGTPIPDDLSGPYFAALGRLPRLVAEAAARPWDRGLLACALASVAVAKGDTEMAEAILEIGEDDPAAYLEWRTTR
jgi:hypothetical protein